ncbi:MAG TPA: DUF4159 domain-containing protein [Bryobacteraceae bacterium]|jgi:hypothetical protein|nr:DUF4159 domain-containing protein [Bryobacteraceae bacterium]
MWLRRGLAVVVFGLAVIGAVYGFQNPFRQYRSYEPYDNVRLPDDWQDKTEWVFARLMYPEHPNALLARRFRFGMPWDWHEGGTSWTQDYPRADRHFVQALRRLTRISVRSVEQPTDPDDLNDFYNWPWMNAGEMGDWKLTPKEAATIREYLLRGGFMMFDDFWGPEEYERFDESMKLIFPERPVVEMENKDGIFHTVYDLDDRPQVLGDWCIHFSLQCQQRALGTRPHWMGVYDDKNRVMIAISFNNDVGDAWEWADGPQYPEKMAGLAIKLGVNYVIYAMTH